MITWMKEIYDIVTSKFDVFFTVWKNVIFERAHNSIENVENEGKSANNFKPLFSRILIAMHSFYI